MSGRFAEYRAAERTSAIYMPKVLIVDDELKDLKSHAGILEKNGFHVQACSSYVDGAICAERELFDFVIVSQGSRAFEGRAVVERMLAQERHIPVLVLTPFVDMDCYLEAMQLGAADYLEKPLIPSELIYHVETHLRRRTAAA